jgi:histidine triad (HIT) family protein
MTHDPTCIFCKIIKNEIQAEKVYEDEQLIAFLDINPVSKGHILLIPKKHFVWIQDLPNDLYSYLMIKAKEIIPHLKQALEADYIQLSVVGKDVPHVHVHLIPRYFDDNASHFSTTRYEEGEEKKTASSIRSFL